MIDISIATLALSYVVAFWLGLSSGLLVCCRWRDRFMTGPASNPNIVATSSCVPVEPVVASAPHITEIKLSQ